MAEPGDGPRIYEPVEQGHPVVPGKLPESGYRLKKTLTKPLNSPNLQPMAQDPTTSVGQDAVDAYRQKIDTRSGEPIAPKDLLAELRDAQEKADRKK